MAREKTAEKTEREEEKRRTVPLYHDMGESGVVFGREFHDNVFEATPEEAEYLLENPHWRRLSDTEVSHYKSKGSLKGSKSVEKLSDEEKEELHHMPNIDPDVSPLASARETASDLKDDEAEWRGKMDPEGAEDAKEEAGAIRALEPVDTEQGKKSGKK